MKLKLSPCAYPRCRAKTPDEFCWLHRTSPLPPPRVKVRRSEFACTPVMSGEGADGFAAAMMIANIGVLLRGRE